MRKSGVWSLVSSLAVLACATCWILSRSDSAADRPKDESLARFGLLSADVPDGRADSAAAQPRAAVPAAGMRETADGDETPMPEEERRERVSEAAEEAAVDAFDALTDKWMEEAPGQVTMKEVDRFVAAFRRIPKARQDECVHRALNLVPDGNVMLLAGLLMDKSLDREIVETVFNDVLNRDEDVKKPILQEIFKDRTHPCWTDVAWILDVTGELPKKDAP